jgi:hypothetical protein
VGQVCGYRWIGTHGNSAAGRLGVFKSVKAFWHLGAMQMVWEYMARYNLNLREPGTKRCIDLCHLMMQALTLSKCAPVIYLCSAICSFATAAFFGLCPNILLPTRTFVEPILIATSKSSLMPILNSTSPSSGISFNNSSLTETKVFQVNKSL